jgi:FHA domain-containing protein
MTIVPRLLIRDDDGSERVVDLAQGVVRIGRSLDNEIVLADADKGVSRAHAELHVQNGRYVIVDLQSQNGTWLNGLRVQRAEVRPDAEIGIGTYRLTLQLAPTVPAAADRSGTGPMVAGSGATLIGVKPPARPATLSSPPPASAAVPSSRAPISRPAAAIPTTRLEEPINVPAAVAAQQPAASRTPLLIGSIVAVAVIGVVVGRFVIPSTKAPAATVGSTVPAAAVTPEPAAVTPRPEPPPPEPLATAPSEPPGRPHPTSGSPTNGTAPVRSASRGSAAAAEATRTFAPELPVTRKPGESVEQWRERGQALQARYAYSKVALDRGDYAAAAGGFAAILLDEPGFLDAPQLLVKARDGLRAAALAALESGKRLDATGDWASAMRKYEQAREIDKSVPGLEDAFKRVREKMRVAGAEAMRRARLYDGAGRSADAMKEYEKAAQWLPGDDPDREVARSRADQLKAKLR